MAPLDASSSCTARHARLCVRPTISSAWCAKSSRTPPRPAPCGWNHPPGSRPRKRRGWASETRRKSSRCFSTLPHAPHATPMWGVGLMVSANRVYPPADAVALAHLAAHHAGRGVVAFGLADDEMRGPPEPFAAAFAIARTAGLISAPHAGEHGGPDSVRGALDTLAARRIQHGVRAAEDPALLERLAAEEVCLDVCPTSNVQLRVVSSYTEHPLRKLLDAGVQVSLNADDPLFFGSGVLGEYELARQTFDSTTPHSPALPPAPYEPAAPRSRSRSPLWSTSTAGSPELSERRGRASRSSASVEPSRRRSQGRAKCLTWLICVAEARAIAVRMSVGAERGDAHSPRLTRDSKSCRLYASGRRHQVLQREFLAGAARHAPIY